MTELALLRAKLQAAVRIGDREKARALTALCFKVMSKSVAKLATDLERANS